MAAQVATAFGALLAAGSLAVGLVGSVLYRIKERDALATQFRMVIATLQPRVGQLNDMVSFELARELASAAVHSRDLELPLEDLYEYCRPDSGQRPTKAEVAKFLEDNFPTITVSLNTPLVSQYQNLTTSLASDVAVYRMVFPGIFRLVSSIALLLENVLTNEKAIARDERMWIAVLPELMADDARITSPRHMKWMIGEFVTSAVMTHMRESRKQIGLLTEMLDLAFDTYLDKTASELNRLGRKERKEKIRSMAETDRIPEDLREAEKCLRHAFTEEKQRSRYRRLLDDFEGTGDRENLQPPPDDFEEALESAAGAGSP